jgi:hypothetical protein
MAREERYLAMEPAERNGNSPGGQSSMCFCGGGDDVEIALGACRFDFRAVRFQGRTMKVITLIARRPGSSRAEFRDYYENIHAPLGSRYFPFDKYVRNHLVTSRPEDAGFDVLMESWLDRAKAMAILTGEIDQIFAADEARFMNAPPRPEGIQLVTHVLAGPPRGVDPRGVRKIAWFLKADGIDTAAFLERAGQWGAALAAEAKASRAELDEALPGHKSPIFTGDAIMTLWVDADTTPPAVPPPGGVAVQAALVLESHETTPAELKANFGRR